MKIRNRNFVICFFITISTFVFAGEAETNASCTSTMALANEIKVTPRFFSDKLFVSSRAETLESYTLCLYSEQGICIATIPVDLSSREFIYFTQNLHPGTYTYFIRENKQLIVKGTFLK